MNERELAGVLALVVRPRGVVTAPRAVGPLGELRTSAVMLLRNGGLDPRAIAGIGRTVATADGRPRGAVSVRVGIGARADRCRARAIGPRTEAIGSAVGIGRTGGAERAWRVGAG
jgi:hypothetical protein